MGSKNWIAGATKNKGALRRRLKVKKGKKITEKQLNAAIEKGGKLAQEANLAKTLKKLRKKK